MDHVAGGGGQNDKQTSGSSIFDGATDLNGIRGTDSRPEARLLGNKCGEINNSQQWCQCVYFV